MPSAPLPPKPTPIFDEIVHLTTLGGGFLRTPYLHATRELPEGVVFASNDCQPIDAEVIHLPAALRKNGMNQACFPYGHVVFTSDLMKRISMDLAVQYNHQSNGVMFGFHENANHNLAHVFSNQYTQVQDKGALIVDNIEPGFTADQDDVGFLGTPAGKATAGNMQPSGFLAFISRSWNNLRHVNPQVMMDHHIPLQIDTEFTGGLLLDSGFMSLRIPVYGALGAIRLWDGRLGFETHGTLPGGWSPVAGMTTGSTAGQMRIIYDAYDNAVLEIETTGTLDSVFPIAMMDDAGVIFSRNIVTDNIIPGSQTLMLPVGRFGSPYQATLPADIEITDFYLPPGVNIVGNRLEGTPQWYGGNYYIEARIPGVCGLNERVHLIFSVNRQPRTLMKMVDVMSCDNSTGEYYAVQYMPYGVTLQYGGWNYEFRRLRSGANPYPYMREVPFVYSHSSRRGGIEGEAVWRDESKRLMENYFNNAMVNQL